MDGGNLLRINDLLKKDKYFSPKNEQLNMQLYGMIE